MIKGLFDTAAYMQNRELSWLKFNERVLLEANRQEVPLLERLKFISIFMSNLDEFFMIRIGSLTDSLLLGDKIRDNKTGMTAKEQLSAIYPAITPLYALAGQAYTTLIGELAEHGIMLLKMRDLGVSDLKFMRNHFMQKVLPVLSPSIIDTKHPFPHIPNKQLNIAVTLEKKKGSTFALISIPANLDRLVFLDSNRFVLIEDLILHFTDLAFTNYTILNKYVIAVTRNADFDTAEDLLDEDIDFRQYMKSLLKKRQRMQPVRLEFESAVCTDMLNFLCAKLSLKPAQVFYSDAPLNLDFSFTLTRYYSKEATSSLLWPVLVPAFSVEPSARTKMLYSVLKKDILLSFPFESISPFLSMIRQAAEDTSVLSIKITLYRIDAQSQLVESLIYASENGKDVIVLMELRARFDESNNIEWANRLDEAGCRVIYGLVGYKCHSKLCLITRMNSFGELQYITQVGTGNYNEKTAKLYTDLSLITANPDIGRDAAAFFNNMLTDNLYGEYSELWVAPNSFKSNFMKCIENERQKVLAGGRGRIIIKCNSLTDKEIIEKLAEAGDCGVEITMNIRGICCLLPNIPGVTDNIRVMSVVGKFLEHTRIFCFGEGDDAIIYISSADLMTRNTQRRVEVACPILDPQIKQRIMWMLDIMQSDNTNAWDLQSNGHYVLRKPDGTDKPRSSQEIFVKEAKENAAFLTAVKDGKGDAMDKRAHRKSKLRNLLSSMFKNSD